MAAGINGLERRNECDKKTLESKSMGKTSLRRTYGLAGAQHAAPLQSVKELFVKGRARPQPIIRRTFPS